MILSLEDKIRTLRENLNGNINNGFVASDFEEEKKQEERKEEGEGEAEAEGEAEVEVEDEEVPEAEGHIAAIPHLAINTSKYLNTFV